jgi:predicted secreted protein
MDVPQRITLKEGQTFVLRLQGLGSAGYTWNYSVDENDKVVSVSRAMAGGPTRAPAGGPPPDAYSLDDLFTIQALQPGRVLIRFFQQRSWEKDRPPLKEYALEIQVD